MIDMTLRGFIIVLFGFPVVLNVGVSRWLVPGVQLIVGEWTMIWTGYQPIRPMFGRMHPIGMPLFMIAMTMTSLKEADGGLEGDLVARGPGIDGEEEGSDEPSDPD